MSEITTEIRKISPSDAAEILKQNNHNRSIRSSSVTKMVSDMKNDEWYFDGAPIRIAATGKLLDGQHRLSAVAQSGIPQKFVVVSGLSEDSQTVMDTGRKRTLANALEIQGEIDAKQLAALLMLQWRWDHGIRGGRLFGNSGMVSETTAQKLDPSIPVLLEFLGRNPTFRDVRTVGISLSRASSLTPSVAGLAWTIFHRIDIEDADEFFERLKDGAGLESGSPILALRDRLHAISRENRMRGSRTSPDHILALVIKAWNAYREGRSLIRLYFKVGGANPETFPEPV